MSDKPKWQLLSVSNSEAHVVCTCGDVSVHISETDEGDYHIAKRLKGIWMRADNPLWPDLTAAMAEAELICKGTPPPLSGEWQSCEHGIDADDGDWVLYAWIGKSGWQYAAAQVSCEVDAEDNSESIELLDWDGNQVELEPSDYYLRIER